MYAQIVIILIGFSGFVGLSIVIPVLPHYAATYGASALGATFAFAIAAGVAMFSSIFWGRLSDRIGRKPIVLISLVGQCSAFLWLALADSLLDIYLARALEGLFVGSIAALFASMTDITTPEKRAAAMGRLNAAFTAGFIVGPVLGGVLATTFTPTPTFAYPFAFTSALFALLAVAAFFALPESRTKADRSVNTSGRESVAQRLRIYFAPRMSVPLLATATVAFASNSTSAIFALWALQRFGWGVEETSWAITAMAALVMIWNVSAGPLTSSFGNTRMLLATQVAIFLAFVAMVLVRDPFVLYLILVLAAFGNGLGRTVATTAVSLAAEADHRGEAMGVQSTISSAVTAGGPILVGWLFVTISPSAPFVVIALFAVVAFSTTALYLTFGNAGGKETA